jgi:hypothetical protein
MDNFYDSSRNVGLDRDGVAEERVGNGNSESRSQDSRDLGAYKKGIGSG